MIIIVCTPPCHFRYRSTYSSYICVQYKLHLCKKSGVVTSVCIFGWNSAFFIHPALKGDRVENEKEGRGGRKGQKGEIFNIILTRREYECCVNASILPCLSSSEWGPVKSVINMQAYSNECS